MHSEPKKRGIKASADYALVNRRAMSFSLQLATSTQREGRVEEHVTYNFNAIPLIEWSITPRAAVYQITRAPKEEEEKVFWNIE